MLDAVLPLLNTGARIPVCGLISQYNATALPNGLENTPQAFMGLLQGENFGKRVIRVGEDDLG